MGAVLLALGSAFLFGAMTVALRSALARGHDALAGTLATVLVAFGVAGVSALARGELDLAGLWPFALAGLLGPGLSQVLFTLAVREVGASRASATAATAPLFSVALALVLLGEPAAPAVLAGALMIVGGGCCSRRSATDRRT